MQYELDESDLCSMDLLSILLDKECLLNLCSLEGRSTMGDIITVFCWWYWDLSFFLSLLSFNRMELLECCILLDEHRGRC